MGVDYSYVNMDKNQYFLCGLYGHSSRFSAIGNGPAARALALLLSERGSWRNDRVSVVADTSEEWDHLRPRCIDIGVEAELLLLDVDGVEWLEERLERSVVTFTRLCDFAVHLRRLDVLRLLDSKYGAGHWQRKYESSMRSTTNTRSQKVFDAKHRGLCIYALPP